MDQSSRSSGVSSVLASALSDLPSTSELHFSRMRRLRGSAMHPTIYIGLRNNDPPASQVITTDKTNLLLRYLNKQADDKKKSQKRSLEDSSFDMGMNGAQGDDRMEEDDVHREIAPTHLVFPPPTKRQKTTETD